MKKIDGKIGVVFLSLLFLIIAISLFYYFSYEADELSFNTLLLKNSIMEEGSVNNNLKIKNNKEMPESFYLEVRGDELKDLVKLNENNFNLKPGEEKNLEIEFNSKGKSPGIYIGNLAFNNNEKIPIILEIQSKEVFFDSNLNIFPKGTSFIPGERLNAEMRVFDLLNIGKSSVVITYFVRDFEGKTIIFESENRVIQGQVEDYSKSFVLPDDIDLGNYVFATTIEYEDSVGTSSAFFNVVEEKLNNQFIFNNSFLLVLISLFFLAFLIFIYSLFYRDKLLRELHNQYKNELRRQREIIDLKSKLDYKRLDNLRERKEYSREVKAVKKNRLKELKKMYKGRVSEFYKLKKSGNKKQLISKLKKWKKQGYNTKVLENKFKMPNLKYIKNKLKKWKKQGYDTSILDKKIR